MYTERLNDKEKNERNMDGLLTRGLKDINKKKNTKTRRRVRKRVRGKIDRRTTRQTSALKADKWPKYIYIYYIVLLGPHVTSMLQITYAVTEFPSRTWDRGKPYP